MDDNTIRLFGSRNSDEWETPQDKWETWNKEFGFTLNAAATQQNTKCRNYYSLQDNSLMQPWTGRVWCNPPYSKIKQFLQKAVIERPNCEVIVFLTFANTDTQWFHRYVLPYAEIRFIEGRLKFKGINTKGELVQNSAMRPSILIIYRRNTV